MAGSSLSIPRVPNETSIELVPWARGLIVRVAKITGEVLVLMFWPKSDANRLT